MTKIMTGLINELKTKKVIFGARTAVKEAKKQNVEKIYLTNDCPEDIMDKLQNKEDKMNITKLEMTKEELKELCQKPFNISVICILKEKDKEGKFLEKTKKVSSKDKEEKLLEKAEENLKPKKIKKTNESNA